MSLKRGPPRVSPVFPQRLYGNRSDKKYQVLLAVPARLELATFGLGNRCSIRLSYGTNSKKRVFRRVRRHKIQIAALYSIRCPAETSVLSGNAPDTARAMIAMI
jgi:hypothetical protein